LAIPSRLFAAPGLNTGLFIRQHHEVISAQWGLLPHALIQVKDTTGLGSIARENPAAMLPGAQGIVAKPAPQGCAADLRDEPLSNNVPADSAIESLDKGSPRRSMWKLTGGRLNLNYEAEGKANGSPTSWLLIKPGNGVLVEAFSPLVHDLARRFQACGDAIVGPTFCSQQDDLGPYHLAIMVTYNLLARASSSQRWSGDSFIKYERSLVIPPPPPRGRIAKFQNGSAPTIRHRI
jgi:hypothetical protein